MIVDGRPKSHHNPTVLYMLHTYIFILYPIWLNGEAIKRVLQQQEQSQ